MAQATKAFTKERLSAPSNAGAPTAASTQPLDNHDTVAVTNLSSSGTLLVQILAADAVAALSENSAIEILPGNAEVIPIGTTASRAPYGTSGSEETLYYNGVGAIVTAQVVYYKKTN
jgi:hypothetical protein